MPSRLRILLWSALSGVLWALAWPAIGGLTWLAFVAWLPLLHAERLHNARTEGRKRAFYPYVLVATFIWNLSCSWWFFCVSEPLASKLISVGAPVLVNTFLMGVPWWLKRVVRRTHGELAAAFAFILFWIALEFHHHDWDLQWPWFTLGNVFGTTPQMVQWYAVTGVLGGSLWILLANLLVDEALRRKTLWNTVTTSLFLGVPWGLSVALFNSYQPGNGRMVEVVVVQPNIDPYREKFSGVDPLEQLERMLALADAQMTDSTLLVVFPETALQEGAAVDMSTGDLHFHGLWENDLEASRSVRRLERFQAEHPRAALLCGMSSDRWFRQSELPAAARPLGDGQHWYEAYNAALWMPARGNVESYHKSKLVTGVEHMPFEEVLGPLADLALDLGGTTGSLGQQEERSVLRDGTSGLAVAPAICYESVFGEHVAEHVRNGAQLIAVITNDGWWDDSPGYRQHLAFSSLRAIETHRSVVRSANTGISCIIDPNGDVRERTSWWTPAAFRTEVELHRSLTFYVMHGDFIGRGALVAAIVLLLLSIVRRVRKRRSV